MAIVQMKKLRLLVVKNQRRALLRDLQRLGCVEIGEPAEALSAQSSLMRCESDLAELRARRARFSDSIRLLEKYAPEKAPLLQAKPEISTDELLDEAELAQGSTVCEAVSDLDGRIRADYQEEMACRFRREVLLPWKDLEIPIDSTGTERVAVRLGTLPIMADYDALCRELSEAVPESELNLLSSDEHTRFLCAIYLKIRETEALDVLRRFGFSVPNFGEMTGLAADNLAREEAHMAELEQSRDVLTAQIVGYAGKRALLKRCYDRIGVQEAAAEAQEKLLTSGNIVCLEGWCTAPEEAALTALLDRYDCAYELTEPTEAEYPDVPVKLKNNKVTDGLNMVTNMYSLPQYGTVDPNPLMAPFFIPFYGIMMADMGYGLLMVIASLVAMRRIRPKEGTLSFCRLLLWCGITTFIMGALTGGFFGDAPYQVVHLLNPESSWAGLPALFSPLNDSIYVLIGAMILGVLQLNTGLAVSFVQKLKHGDVLDAILYEASLWIILAGILLFAAASVLSAAALALPGKIVIAVGAVLLLAGAMRGKKGLGKFTAVFGVLYNELTGWFGDILSYSRIMALMLAGSVIGQVFNTIGAMFGSIFLFIPIFLIGHALNFGLNLLGCYVHDLRLQCLEYFGKFYTDGGRPFSPLKLRTKYVDLNDAKN